MARRIKNKDGSALPDTGLGELEATIMRVIWEKNKTTVKDVFIELYPVRRLAYTTIMTVMRRLADKGILEQDKSKKTYYYKPNVDQDKMAASMISAVVDKVMGGANVELLIEIIKNFDIPEEELAAFEAELTKVPV